MSILKNWLTFDRKSMQTLNRTVCGKLILNPKQACEIDTEGIITKRKHTRTVKVLQIYIYLHTYMCIYYIILENKTSEIADETRADNVVCKQRF